MRNVPLFAPILEMRNSRLRKTNSRTPGASAGKQQCQVHGPSLLDSRTVFRVRNSQDPPPGLLLHWPLQDSDKASIKSGRKVSKAGWPASLCITGTSRGGPPDGFQGPRSWDSGSPNEHLSRFTSNGSHPHSLLGRSAPHPHPRPRPAEGRNFLPHNGGGLWREQKKQ